jgi:hypothetical protein
MKHPVISQYLERYAEPDGLQGFSEHHSHVVVIPIANEDPRFLTTLESIQQAAGHTNARPLVICVINGRAGAPDAYQANTALLDALKRLGRCQERQAPWVEIDAEGLTLLVCARFSPPFEFGPKEGVGTARKIGCDLALSLLEKGAIGSPWIRSTDADVRVPVDYFEDPRERGAAMTLPFLHTGAPQELHLYEMSLRYYVMGLTHAGSPYAFHTVGSTLFIQALDYAKVRGFPKRLAGEDFYLLNKLAKTGAILSPDRLPLRIRHRESERVPFGTGPAVIKILREAEQQRVFSLYHPQVFDRLQSVLLTFPHVATRRDLSPLRAELGDFEPGWSGLQKMVRQGCGDDVLLRQLHAHFDAFRTLKWIHHLRDNGLPKLPWQEALAHAAFIPKNTTDPAAQETLLDLETQVRRPRQGIPTVDLSGTTTR